MIKVKVGLIKDESFHYFLAEAGSTSVDISVPIETLNDWLRVSKEYDKMTDEMHRLAGGAD